MQHSNRPSFAWLLSAVVVFGTPLAAQGLRINPPLVPFGDVSRFVTSPDSRYAVYLADQDVNNKHELYSVTLDFPYAVRKLSDEAGAAVSEFFQISPDSRRVVYRAGPLPFELFSVDIRGEQPPVRLSGTLTPGRSVSSDFAISSDSARVVYTADQDVNDVFELYSVPITGGTPRKLNAALPTDGDVVGQFTLTPDSTLVVYAADQEVDGRFELYSVPIDGGAPPVKLTPVPVAGGGVFPTVGMLAISPDSAWVVFRADLLVDDRIELFSAPLDGSSPAARLNGPLAPFGQVWGFVLSPDSSRVAYVAQEASSGINLFGVAIDGSSPSVRLNPSQVGGEGVSTQSLQVTPDSSYVVYTRYQAQDGVFELFSVPLDGSGVPVRLYEPMPWGPHVQPAPLVSADSTRVVFKADLDEAGVYELYSSPIAPAFASVTRLGSGGVLDFLLDPRGALAAYRAVPDANGATHLWSVSLHDGRPPRRVSPPLAANGEVREYAFTPSGKRLVCLAGREAQNVIELFETYLTPKLRPGR